MFSSFSEHQPEFKTVKANEMDIDSKDESTIYDPEDLVQHIKSEGQITLENNFNENKRTVKSTIPKPNENEMFFKDLNTQLEEL